MTMIPALSLLVVNWWVLAPATALVAGVLAGAAYVTLAREVRRQAAAAAEKEARLALVVEQLPAIVWTTDRQMRVTSCQGAGLAALGARRDQTIGLTIEQVLGRRFGDSTPIDAHRKALAGEPVSYAIEYAGHTYQAHIEPLRDASGAVVGTIGLSLDVTERTRAERALRAAEARYHETSEGALRHALHREKEAAEHLRALNEMKDAFLTAVSHELRTPLATVRGFAETLQVHDARLSPAERREFLHRLAANAGKLDRLLTDLLDLDRLNRGIIEPRRRPTDMRRLVGRVVREAGLPTTLDLSIDVERVVADVDAAQVERIVENLLVNAVRHTPSGTSVWIRARAEDAGLLLIVEDAGPGIPAELRDGIFEPFRQGPGRSPHAPGVGIGLSLVARFARSHGGRAWVERRAGGGASFRVWMPAEVTTVTASWGSLPA